MVYLEILACVLFSNGFNQSVGLITDQIKIWPITSLISIKKTGLNICVQNI